MTKTGPDMTIEEICRAAPVVPVLVIDDVEHARPLAEALVAGGLPALEVTLRTPAALEAIQDMATVPGAIVGAGTIVAEDDLHAAIAAGARFGVSPGSTPRLLDALDEAGLPFLPGGSTASEAMALFERGYGVQKFFPAEAAGGVAMLKSLGGPLSQLRFCPTGGVSPANKESYLSLPNVICVGGSWVAPKALMDDGDWDAITALAQEAARF